MNGHQDHDQFCEVATGRPLCYRTSGDPEGEPLLLVAGLGLDLTSWPREMTDALEAAGFFLIRFDNRDAGRSFHVGSPAPGPLRWLTARPRRDAYDLGDMARDTVRLLDHLELARAHVLGVSMGGMIAQTVAARYPDRILSLTSVFSTTGDRRVGGTAASTLLRMLAPPARTREQAVAGHLRMMRHVGPTGFALDEAQEAAAAARAWDRGGGMSAHAGVARQIGAIHASGDRTAELRRVTAPTLVIHGDTDRLVHPSGGRATAAAITGAHHVTVLGTGHCLAPGAVPRLVGLLTEHARAAGKSRTSSSAQRET
ncbi:alpha/beta fold hydrolase [Streptomyces heilongjiangensis]|uniref:Alpha/beta fold hydrolase n=1 Tax=Streptomyces heilongjiangensis TaxID=945052 RepID=A0ABW1BJC4_9ACTN|nr:alpha/beta fold hydrolase [Streptomyces heilongjiangensis]MDC2952452.1 alpha/beta fold hydrolase [Streptomyces heilongjiangensis]